MASAGPSSSSRSNLTANSLRFLFAIAAVAAVAGTSGCQAFCAYGCPESQRLRTTVTVIPAAADGHIGTVVVGSGDQRAVLDTAYASATVKPGRQPSTYTASEQQVQRTFSDLLQTRPPVPVSIAVYFDSGTDEMSQDPASLVEQLRAEIERRDHAEITVIGHTDRRGSESRNDILAARRANHVRDQLIASGLNPDRIAVVARGEREPLVPTPDGVAEPRNRRVEINIR